MFDPDAPVSTQAAPAEPRPVKVVAVDIPLGDAVRLVFRFTIACVAVGAFFVIVGLALRGCANLLVEL